ncbi:MULTISPECIES: site-specific DNA-methyltransferase [unclassified Campylobacter]|uniref:site-specific DNA-methyltransferase n=1 Tax=unclassified Campylobacter TaxID=2593542 RepID=UPI0022EA09FD|nr:MULTISPECIES: site-specific DNA-methyltransferase [unclassified Campylobacter]MDA3042633.1 site-specific DNA-methyltransferase [Campylobacter sp. JMF_09 ED2]MDA3044553.1 site-specific DNA-methyltransferase [Campylobacter sp. JMF_07 ED4]MDA3063324.1 site-specific DNA-methyltransferase [Campylobacter sp. JMF_11 EL3]MDA3071530.1 site-specific DNA-methyltransferase [Campylobacter sp. VBCF_03 NA9]MDA3074406.1 site-specific DNA-methyltransferase [Campylobacter sp. JMF_05 ED3]
MQTVITNKLFNGTVGALKACYDTLSRDGCFFALYRTEYYKNGNVKHDFLDIIDEGIKKGYEYVNTIVFPTEHIQNASFADNVIYIVWFAKERNNMRFNKDLIREKHIWKDVEWGKRTKNYNPKGKDPGNVWIPTEDDGNAHITNHILLTIDDIVKRLIRMTECGSDYYYYDDKAIQSLSICKRSIYKASENNNKSNSLAQVIFGTSETMKSIKNKSVKVMVTSPPYWNLKDYYKKGQIGQENYEVYLDRMKRVWSECYSKLDKTGSLWININIRTSKGKPILIPKDFVTICKLIGFKYRGILIWHKSSGIPTNNKNVGDHHEYIMLFSKSESFAVDDSIFKSFKDYKNDIISGKAFWNINRKAGSVGKKYIHPAIYPNDLSTRIIKISTTKGELVVDPFLGSGTTLISALSVHRSCIGYEYNEGFSKLMLSRFESEIPGVKVKMISE